MRNVAPNRITVVRQLVFHYRHVLVMTELLPKEATSRAKVGDERWQNPPQHARPQSTPQYPQRNQDRSRNQYTLTPWGIV